MATNPGSPQPVVTLRNNGLWIATIANGGTTSQTIVQTDQVIGGFSIPAAFTGTSVTFLVSPDNSQAFQALYDETGTQVSVPVSAGRSYSAPAALAAWSYVQFVSSAAEGGARSIYVVAKS